MAAFRAWRDARHPELGDEVLLADRLGDLTRAIEAERLRGEEWRARALGAEAEREALRREKGLPWWRRLLGGPAELSGPTPGAPSDEL